MWGTAVLAGGTVAAAIVTTAARATHLQPLVIVVVDGLQNRVFVSLALHMHSRAYAHAVGVIVGIAYCQLWRALFGVHLAECTSAVESAQKWVVNHLALICNRVNLCGNRISIHKAHIIVVNIRGHGELNKRDGRAATLPSTLKSTIAITGLANEFPFGSPLATCSWPEAA